MATSIGHQIMIMRAKRLGKSNEFIIIARCIESLEEQFDSTTDGSELLISINVLLDQIVDSSRNYSALHEKLAYLYKIISLSDKFTNLVKKNLLKEIQSKFTFITR